MTQVVNGLLEKKVLMHFSKTWNENLQLGMALAAASGIPRLLELLLNALKEKQLEEETIENAFQTWAIFNGFLPNYYLAPLVRAMNQASNRYQAPVITRQNGVIGEKCSSGTMLGRCRFEVQTVNYICSTWLWWNNNNWSFEVSSRVSW